jgi:hypothetical protein
VSLKKVKNFAIGLELYLISPDSLLLIFQRISSPRGFAGSLTHRIREVEPYDTGFIANINVHVNHLQWDIGVWLVDLPGCGYSKISFASLPV